MLAFLGGSLFIFPQSVGPRPASPIQILRVAVIMLHHLIPFFPRYVFTSQGHKQKYAQQQDACWLGSCALRLGRSRVRGLCFSVQVSFFFFFGKKYYVIYRCRWQNIRSVSAVEFVNLTNLIFFSRF